MLSARYYRTGGDHMQLKNVAAVMVTAYPAFARQGANHRRGCLVDG